MKADSYKISEVFSSGGNIHYVLPHFQREYRWKQKNWETLLDDAWQMDEALAQGQQGHNSEHFLGALVTLPDGNIGLNVPVHRLVDGQQRLTTLSLLLCAFARLIALEEPELVAGINSYLFNNASKGNARYKLLPTQKNGDRAAYIALLEGHPIPLNQSRIPEAFDFFKKALEKKRLAGELDATRFFHVLTQTMQVVCIRLNAEENAYQIFESLNNKAEPLKQSDLVRNYIAMRLSSGRQEAVFQKHWAPMEDLLDDNRLVGRSNLGELTAFLRHYDAMTTGSLPSEKHIYARFRDEMKSLTSEDQLIEQLATLQRFAAYYDHFLRPDKGLPSKLQSALRRLAALDVTTAYPFLLAVADKVDNNVISTDEYVAACVTLENYLLRRFLIDAPSHFLNKMFASLARAIDWDDFIPSLRKALAERSYPSDSRVRQIFLNRPLYGKANVREKVLMLFESINRHLYEGSDVIPQLANTATLEHILPQHPSITWQSELGEDYADTLREWKDTVGNLTLVTQSYNSSLSNDSFTEKRIKLAAHGLRLNSDYFSQQIEKWDAEAIQNRAEWLTEKILEIWPSFTIESAATKRKQAPPTPPPKAIVIRGERFVVHSQRDAMRQAAAFVGRLDVDFFALQKILPNLLKQSPFIHANYAFGNGWHLNVNWSAEMSLNYTRRFLNAAGIGDNE